jgi:hypothetical protein
MSHEVKPIKHNACNRRASRLKSRLILAAAPPIDTMTIVIR